MDTFARAPSGSTISLLESKQNVADVDAYDQSYEYIKISKVWHSQNVGRTGTSRIAPFDPSLSLKSVGHVILNFYMSRTSNISVALVSLFSFYFTVSWRIEWRLRFILRGLITGITLIHNDGLVIMLILILIKIVVIIKLNKYLPMQL